MTALHLDADHARRFLVARHFLAPPRALPSSEEAVLAVVDRLGSLQFDPLDVPGARNHDLVLHARLRGPVREHCEALLYPGEGPRRLFEAYNKSLNILPLDDLPFHRVAFARGPDTMTGRVLREHAKVARKILARLAAEGPLAPSAFDQTARIDGYWGTSTSLSRHVLEALFVTGQVAIARREGVKRVYDLPERVFPEELHQRRVDAEEAWTQRLFSRHRAVGLMGEGGATELVTGTGTARERVRRTHALVDRGLLLRAHVEGVKGVRHVLAGELHLLEETARHSRRAKAVAFLAPLDPLMWDRRLVLALFGFDYVWEVYTPLAKRKHGYYVLPILFGDRLVGRVEPRFDRKETTLHVRAVWLERGFALETPGFEAAFHDALSAYARFVGATRTTFGRGKLAAALGGKGSA
ncbi:MAG: YcaQ family DNA glycosylase [Myxococcales bacterium]|nr:YcaQ family DNA glycosylase [Myxococcales bacterium]